MSNEGIVDQKIRQYSETAKLRDINGDAINGEILVEVRGFELQCFLPAWITEGWRDMIYPGGYVDGAKPMKDGLGGKEMKVLLSLMDLSTNKTPLQVKWIKSESQGGNTPYHYFISGTVLDIVEIPRQHKFRALEKMIFIDCGVLLNLFVANEQEFKVGEYITSVGRLDARKTT